jgi:hypothetical protein
MSYLQEKKKINHVPIGRNGSMNWLVMGMSIPMVAKNASISLRIGAGAGVMTAEKSNRLKTKAYCKSYSDHLCFLSRRMFSNGEKDVSMAETDDAGDCLLCSFDRNRLLMRRDMGFVIICDGHANGNFGFTNVGEDGGDIALC